MSSSVYAEAAAKDQKVSLDLLQMAIKKDDLQLFNFALEQSLPSGLSLPLADSMIVHYQISNATMQQAVHLAAEYGRLKIIKRLVEDFKCDLNVRCGLTGYTPIMYAVQCGNQEMVEYLLEKGSDLRPKSICGRDALKIALDNDENSMINLIKDFQHRKFDTIIVSREISGAQSPQRI